MDELTFLSAQTLAQLIGERRVSSLEVVESHLQRINALNPALNAIVTLDAQRARARAGELDAALARGEVYGPLHGVPVTIKDSFETEGLLTTFGHRFRARHIPRRNATVAARMLEAGAVILGKTNIPEMSWDWQTKSPIFGRANNPFNLGYTPGGSGGGGAAAVAAGLSALEIGADGAGSIRVPAHFCGLFGLMPTAHRVSGAGHMEIRPQAHSTRSNLTGFGPIARSIGDLRLALRVIAGPDNIHADVLPVPLETSAAPKRLSECRFSWTDDFGGVPVTAETRAALKMLAEELRARGCRVERAAPPGLDFEEALETCGEMWGYEGGQQANFPSRLGLRLAYTPMFGRAAWTRGFVRGLGLNMRAYHAARERRDLFIFMIDRFLSAWDAWLCPVAATPAFEHRRTGKRIAVDGRKVSYSRANSTYASLFNLGENPVVVLPLARSQEGMPIGVQVVGRR
jgi:amidase